MEQDATSNAVGLAQASLTNSSSGSIEADARAEAYGSTMATAYAYATGVNQAPDANGTGNAIGTIDNHGVISADRLRSCQRDLWLCLCECVGHRH